MTATYARLCRDINPHKANVNFTPTPFTHLFFNVNFTPTPIYSKLTH